MFDFPLFPEQASTHAPEVDAFYFAMVGLSAVFAVLIFLTVTVFAIRYRRKAGDGAPRQIHGNLKLELTWSLIPLGMAMGIFVWSADIYFRAMTPPEESLEIYVVAKQWMWKLQHPEGKREINELHVPTGQPVRLTMTSEDVIHSFFVPAFRAKMDVLPGRYTSVWFEATKPGTYHLFCAEYCGSDHSKMIGRVVVMEPSAYESWLEGGRSGETMAQAGERLFSDLGCATCHTTDGLGRGPSHEGIFGKTVELKGGSRAVVDEGYLRESIVNPNAKLLKGYEPIMPTYEGQISEEGILQLVAYLKSLGPAAPGGADH